MMVLYQIRIELSSCCLAAHHIMYIQFWELLSVYKHLSIIGLFSSSSEWLKVWILHKGQKEFGLKFENCEYQACEFYSIEQFFNFRVVLMLREELNFLNEMDKGNQSGNDNYTLK
ncbi:hypothetical protein CEXT_408681 [Caerostris extrusa]|uniref:Uncharacterized protein n=1 Tax=Caerostris extrusa TaxID=172846 RepID=A0AAV4MTS9_CAEEX|nr:hypothetical protein CEXT_408681 [Caerostris extrusa]